MTEPKTQKAIRATLAESFTRASGVPRLSPETDADYKSQQRLWWQPLTQIGRICEWDVGVASSLVAQSVGKMRRDGLTISSPGSIVKVATAMHAEARASPPRNPSPPDHMLYNPLDPETLHKYK